MNVVEVHSICKSFTRHHKRQNTLKSSLLTVHTAKNKEILQALHNVSFTVKRGEFLGILGRNGAGKSTLLKVLAGIYQPDSGKVTIQQQLAPLLGLGVGFNPELTGRDNVYLSGAIMGLDAGTIQERLPVIANFSGLGHVMDIQIKYYSSGMRARLAFSTAINVDAPLLLIDEILSVGDLAFKEKCAQVFERFKKEEKTIIFVTHSIPLIQQWADRCLLMHEGKITHEGSTRDVILAYRKEAFRHTTHLYHDFSCYGLKNIPTRMTENQKTTEPIITFYISLALEQLPQKSRSFSDLMCMDGYYAMRARDLGAKPCYAIDDDRWEFFSKVNRVNTPLKKDVTYIKKNMDTWHSLPQTDIVSTCGSLHQVENPLELLTLAYNLCTRYLIIQTVVSYETDNQPSFHLQTNGIGCRFTKSWLDQAMQRLEYNVVHTYYNEFDRTKNQPTEGGSAYYLIKK